jgi:hypothetical protein
MTQPQTIDLDLIDKIIEHIPNHTWHLVKQSIVEYFVDNMTSDVLEKLTNDSQGFDCAEEILNSYYEIPDMNKDLVIDMVKIAGIENTVNLLDRLELDKIRTGDYV